MTVDQEILDLKRKLEDINTKRIQTATKLSALEEEKARLLEECKTLGVQDPKKIDEEIKAQELLLHNELTEIKAQLDNATAS